MASQRSLISQQRARRHCEWEDQCRLLPYSFQCRGNERQTALSLVKLTACRDFNCHHANAAFEMQCYKCDPDTLAKVRSATL